MTGFEGLPKGAPMPTDDDVLALLDWSHEGVAISKAIRKRRAEGPFVPPHTARFARNTPERTTP